MSAATYVEELEEIILHCNSYTRAQAMFDWLMPRLFLAKKREKHELLRSWLRVLGNEWSCIDNIGAYPFKEIFHRFRIQKRDLFQLMMTEEEKGFLSSLPEKVLIYRGAGSQNRLGLSWSLSMDVAERFPFLHRYKTSNPLLLCAEVPKSRIYAVKLDRNEQEVIVEVFENDVLLSRPAVHPEAAR